MGTKTHKQYVTRACQVLGVDLLPPTKKVPNCILGTKWLDGFGQNVIDASTWEEAKEQLEKWRLSRFGG